MMRALLLTGAALIAAPAAAQDHSGHAGHQMPAPQEDHSAHSQEEPATDHSSMDYGGHTAPDIPTGPPPPRAFEGPRHAADLYFDESRMAAARAHSQAAHGGMATGVVLAERLEARLADGHEAYAWDVSAWYGSATRTIVFKSEGEGDFGGAVEEAEMQLLWGQAIGPFIDLQAGMRVDVEPDAAAHLVVGAAGLAPYMIHFDAAAFVSHEGDLTARIEAEHDMKLSQRLILQPRVEAELSAQNIVERGVGAGLSSIALGARLRYQIVPEFAPYVGVEYEAATGRTADYLRDAGDDPDGLWILLGLHFWF